MATMPPPANERAALYDQILDGLEEVIRNLSYEPDVQRDLEAIVVLVDRLRRLDT